ncbi:hypothetical protein RCL1_008151 [Eukaryota sp. TZLM3-RCL]
MLPPTNVLVVSGLPVAEEEKLAKLQTVIRKKLTKDLGITPTNIEVPLSEGKTLGFGFFYFNEEKDTKKALSSLNNFQFDKKHVFFSSLLDDIHAFDNVPEEYTPSEVKKADTTTPMDLKEHLLDRRARAQLLTHSRVPLRKGQRSYSDSQTSIHTIDPIEHNRAEIVRDNWSLPNLAPQWSTHGTFLATFHEQGVALYGGKHFELIRRFKHEKVARVLFSSNENFLLTCTTADSEGNYTLKVFEVFSGNELRSFKESTSMGFPFEVYQFSPCEEYLARRMADKVGIYDLTNNMEPIKQAIIRENNVLSISFSPTDPYLAVFVGKGAIPARAILYHLRNKSVDILRTKTLVQVEDVYFYWSPNGDFLLTLTEKKTKSGKNSFFGFELFKLRERDVPCITLPDIRSSLGVVPRSPCWDPSGARYAYLEKETDKRSAVVVCEIQDGKLVELSRYAPMNRYFNSLVWSPQLSVLVAFGSEHPSGHLDFLLVENGKVDLIRQANHQSAHTAQWSPCARFFITTVSHEKNVYDNSFHLYNLRGVLLETVKGLNVYRMKFRPLPPALLSADKLESINAHLKEYIQEFKTEDDALRNLGAGKEAERRRSLRREWFELTNKWAATAAQWGARPTASFSHVEVVEEVEEEKVEE